jgi:hypothetical protein
MTSLIYRRTRTGSQPEVVGLAMLTGILIGAAAASLIAVGWAAGELRWLGAHCRQQIAYWQHQAERARSSAAWLGSSNTKPTDRCHGTARDRGRRKPVPGAWATARSDK